MSVSKATFGIDDVITARDMTNINVDPICIMAYAAWLQAKALSRRSTLPPPQSPIIQPELIARPYLDIAASHVADLEPQILSPKPLSLPPSPSAPTLTPRPVYGLTVAKHVTAPAVVQKPILVRARVFMADRWTVGSLATFHVGCHGYHVD